MTMMHILCAFESAMHRKVPVKYILQTFNVNADKISIMAMAVHVACTIYIALQPIASLETSLPQSRSQLIGLIHKSYASSQGAALLAHAC